MANRLKERLNEAGMTELDLARVLGCSRAVVYHWINEIRTPPKRAITQSHVAEVFGLKAEDIWPEEK